MTFQKAKHKWVVAGLWIYGALCLVLLMTTALVVDEPWVTVACMCGMVLVPLGLDVGIEAYKNRGKLR